MRPWRLLFVVVGLTLYNSLGVAQEITEERLNCDYEACNCVFVELGGNGVLVSLNAEHLFSRRFGFRAGVGALYGVGTSIPLLLSWYNGVERKFELGVGLTFLPVFEGRDGSNIGKSQAILLTSAIALKFQPRFGGFMIRFAVTPSYSLTTKSFFIFGGVSLGHAF